MGINVLSLCDGISCAQIALERAGIEVDSYFAAEIKDIAIQVTQKNYPNTVQVGDVNNLSYSNGILSNGDKEWRVKFDLVCFGSPCQSFSIAMQKDKRIGLEDKERSGLYLECKRVLDEVQPKYFFVENVGSMKEKDKSYISQSLGAEPIRLNSMAVAPARRDRYYWTNIPFYGLQKKGISFEDILDCGYVPREKARALMRSGGGIKGFKDFVKAYRRCEGKGFGNLVYSSKDAYLKMKDSYDAIFKGKSSDEIDEIESLYPELLSFFNDNIRYISVSEMERCQTLPSGYVDGLSWEDAQDVIGDGWTIDVIVEFFKNIN